LQEDCRFVVLGERETMPKDILKMIEEAENESKNNTRATLVMCFNYGGQQEIATAVRRMIEAGVRPEEVTNETFAQYIDHPDVPACDLIVRTSGEQRLSNFMLWRSAYSEFIFLDKYWPDMRASDVTAILETYSQRNRRLGG
jgi:undecaprenyl diphosphate synthase